MPPTYTADVATWIPDVIAAALYDTVFDADRALSAFATDYDELDGKPGEEFTIPTLLANSPADNLAENVPAVDDRLQSGSVTVVIKEGVKSIAYSDRTRFQTNQDVNQIAGGRVGDAMNDRIELDLGAALLSGRNMARDTSGPLTIGAIGVMKKGIPAKMRRRGLVLFGESDVLEALVEDPLVQNAATFGSDEAIRNGAFSRPLRGVEPIAVDDGVLGNITVGGVTGPAVVCVARGMLIRAWQKRASTEIERDARARLTRIVGTMLHGEGVVDTRGVVARAIQ